MSVSNFGFLTEALDRRRQRGLGSSTVISCDNRQSNGDALKKMLLAFVSLRDPPLGDWGACSARTKQGGTDPREMRSMQKLFGDLLPASSAFAGEVSRAF